MRPPLKLSKNQIYKTNYSVKAPNYTLSIKKKPRRMNRRGFSISKNSVLFLIKLPKFDVYKFRINICKALVFNILQIHHSSFIII